MMLHRCILVVFVSMMFTCTAQVKLTYYGDTLQGPVKKLTETIGFSVQAVYTADTGKHMQHATFYSTIKNQPVGTWDVHFDDKGRIASQELFGDSTLCDDVRYSYNSDGRIMRQVSVYCLDHKCRSLRDALNGEITEWAVGTAKRTVTIEQYAYDESGRLLTEEQSSYSDGEPDSTFRKAKYEYNGDSSKAEIREREVSVSATRTTITHYVYDKQGRKLEETMLNNANSASLSDWYNNGVPMTNKTVCRYDTNGHLSEEKSYYIRITSNNVKTYTGTFVGSGRQYYFSDDLKKQVARYYELYREDDGSERKKYTEEKALQDSDERYVRDRYGNVLTKTTNGNIEVMDRKIEYFK